MDERSTLGFSTVTGTGPEGAGLVGCGGAGLSDGELVGLGSRDGPVSPVRNSKMRRLSAFTTCYVVLNFAITG